MMKKGFLLETKSSIERSNS